MTHIRRVNALTGETYRPSKFMQALSEADAYCAELDGLRELQTRVDELTAENTALRAELATLMAGIGYASAGVLP